MSKRPTLRSMLTLLVLAVAGPLGGLLAYSTYAGLQANAAAARASAFTLAQLSAANVYDLLTDAGGALARLADRPLVRAFDPVQCDPLLEEVPVLDPRFADVVLADPAGRVVCSAVARPAGSALAEAGWSGRATSQRAFVVGEPFKDPVTGRWVAMLAYPVTGSDGQVGGLGLALDLARFEAAWRSLALPPGAVISIVNERGVIVARSLDAEQWVGRGARGVEIVDTVLTQAEGQVQARGVDGQERLYGFARVAGSDWHVYAGVPTELVLAETNAIAGRSLGLALLGTLLVVGLTVGVSQRIERPARQLAQAARAIAQTGELTRAPVAGPAELAEVAEQFNAMLDARRLAEVRLQRTHRALTLLSAVNQALVHTDDEQKLLDETCRLAVTVGGYQMAWVGYAEDDPARTVRPVAARGVEAGYLELAAITWADTERGRGPTGIAIRTGQNSLARNILDNPDYAPWQAAARERGYASSAAIPLRASDPVRVFGALNIYAAEPDAFDADEVRLLSELADDLAFGLGALRRWAERNQAVAALRESEERLARVVETVPDAITIVDAAGQIMFANAAAERILGLTRSHLTGRQYDDPAWRITAMDGGPFPPEALPFAQVMRSGQAVYGVEHAIEHPDGRRVVLSINAAPLREASGALSGMVAAISDITERQAAEAERERLLAREQAAHAEAAAGRARLADVLERMGDAFVALDVDWRYTYMNRKAGQIFNRRPEAMLGRHIWTEFPEDIGQPFYHAYYRAVETQIPVTLEEYYPPYDRWFENRVYPSADGLAIFFQDITERKRAEAVLAEAYRKTEETLALLQSVLDNAPIGLAFVDRDYRFVRLNAALAEINGLALEAHLGRCVAEVLPGLWPTLEPLYRGVLETGQPVVNVEVSGETAAAPGQERHWLANYYPVQAAGGLILGVGVVVLEITERRRTAEAAVRERDFSNVALDSLPGIVYLYDYTGKFLRWNRNFEVVSGYPADEIARMSPLDYFVGAEKA